MSSLRNELPLWRSVSGKLDQLYMTEKMSTNAQNCPFCGRSSVRLLETVDGPDAFTKITFFTCRSCGENWSAIMEE